MISKNMLSKCVGFVQYVNQFSFITKLKFWRRKLSCIFFFLSDWLFCDCDWPDGPTTFLEFGKTLTWITWRGQVNVKSLVFLSGQANKNSSEIILMTWTERCNCGVVYAWTMCRNTCNYLQQLFFMLGGVTF